MFSNGSKNIYNRNIYIFNEKRPKRVINSFIGVSIFGEFRRILGLSNPQLKISALSLKYRKKNYTRSALFLRNLSKNNKNFIKNKILKKYNFLKFMVANNIIKNHYEFWYNIEFLSNNLKIKRNLMNIANSAVILKFRLRIIFQRLMNFLIGTGYSLLFIKIIKKEVKYKAATHTLVFLLKSLKIKTFNNKRLDNASHIEFNKKLIESYYFNKMTRRLYLKKKLNFITPPHWFGVKAWNFKKNNKLNSMVIIFNLYFKIFKKNSINYSERISSAIALLGAKNFTYKFSYRNSLIKLNQSWGNFGKLKKINKYKSRKNSKNIRKKRILSEINSKIANLGKNSLYSSLVMESKRDQKYNNSFNLKMRALSDKKNIENNPIYINWLRAGYIVFSNKYTSMKNLIVSGNRLNHNTIFDSKVFGHPFHLVNPSILPLTLSFVFFTVIQDLLSSFWLDMWYSNIFSVFSHSIMLGFFFTVMVTWVLEIYSEEQGGFHTLEVQNGFRYAILLFILSELMLFISFFWAYFHFSLNSNSFTGGSYTPRGLVPFYSFRIPLLNTLLLLASGLSLTVAHTLIIENDKLTKILIWVDVLANKLINSLYNFWNDIVGGFVAETDDVRFPDKNYFITSVLFYKRFAQISAKLNLYKRGSFSNSKQITDNYSNNINKFTRLSNDFQINIPKSFIINFRSLQKNTIWQPNYWILDTVLKGFVFLIFQAYEYTSCMFSMNDGVYGAVFFSLTGLHGIHVFLGVMFLLFGFIINLKKNSVFKYNEVTSSYYKKINKFWGKGYYVKNSLNYKIWTHRIAFDGAAWYWHFVDVVWFFVFVFVYWWGFSA